MRTNAVIRLIKVTEDKRNNTQNKVASSPIPAWVEPNRTALRDDKGQTVSTNYVIFTSRKLDIDGNDMIRINGTDYLVKSFEDLSNGEFHHMEIIV